MCASMSPMKVVVMTTMFVMGVDKLRKCAAEMVDEEASWSLEIDIAPRPVCVGVCIVKG